MENLKGGLVLLVDSELLIVDAQLYLAILAALPCRTGGGLVEGLANAVSTGSAQDIPGEGFFLVRSLTRVRVVSRRLC